MVEKRAISRILFRILGNLSCICPERQYDLHAMRRQMIDVGPMPQFDIAHRREQHQVESRRQIENDDNNKHTPEPWTCQMGLALCVSDACVYICMFFFSIKRYASTWLPPSNRLSQFHWWKGNCAYRGSGEEDCDKKGFIFVCLYCTILVYSIYTHLRVMDEKTCENCGRRRGKKNRKESVWLTIAPCLFLLYYL